MSAPRRERDHICEHKTCYIIANIWCLSPSYDHRTGEHLMARICLDFLDLTLGYSGKPVVDHVNGTLQTGSLTAMVGPNGAGKSTLLKGIAGILRPIYGKCTTREATRIAYLPQEAELDRSFPARVIDPVSLGLWPRCGFVGGTLYSGTLTDASGPAASYIDMMRHNVATIQAAALGTNARP